MEFSLCKEIIVAKVKEVKPGRFNFTRKAVAQKWLFLQ
jgi:hypothetical protein